MATQEVLLSVEPTIVIETGVSHCGSLVMSTTFYVFLREASLNRSWGPENHPMTAARSFLKSSVRFEVERALEVRLMCAATPNGNMRCGKD